MDLEEAKDNENIDEEDAGFYSVKERQMARILTAIQMTALILAVIWGLIRHIKWWDNLWFTWWIFAAILLGLTISGLSNCFVNYLIKKQNSTAKWMVDELMGPSFQNFPISFCIIFSLMSGFCEEALFRGVLMEEFGLIISSVIFGLLHTGSKRLILMGIWAGVVGLIMGWLYTYTGSLLVSVGLHSANNFLSFMIMRSWRKKD